MYITLKDEQGFIFYLNCDDIRCFGSNKLIFRNGESLDLQDGVSELIAEAIMSSTDFVKIEREKIARKGAITCF